MARFEIINPSDKVFISGDDFKAICLATIVLGNLSYGLVEVDVLDGATPREMPVMLFGVNDEWFKRQFGQTLAEISAAPDWDGMAAALESVTYARERTSASDIGKWAADIAKGFREKIPPDPDGRRGAIVFVA